jgi:hypothetical protein
VSLQLPDRRLREGLPVLAVPVGTGRHELLLARLKGLRTAPGYRVGPQGVLERHFEGFYKEEGSLYLYGPWEPGVLLEEVLQKNAQEALPFLRRLAQALAALGERRPRGLATDAVRFLEDGAVELLSPEVMQQVRGMQPDEHRRLTFVLLNHPEPRGDPLSFCLAAMLYRLLAGDYPFAAASEEEVRRRMREMRLPPLSLARPGVREEVSAAVMDGLGRGSGEPPSLARWAELLAAWEARGLLRDLSEAEAAELAAQARRTSGLAARAYRRGVFWQRHWRTILIAAAAAAAVGIFSGTVLRNLLKPRSTHGYSPLQVVETFYRGIDSLDHERMQDCVTGRAGRQLIDQVINVYVISRVNLGYEGRALIRSAGEWDRQGRPPVKPPESVFGITNLSIQQLAGQPQPLFRVSYLFWTPDPEKGTASQERRDLVTLRKQGGDWVIFRLEPEPGG